jgi:choline kinase
MTRAIILAAGLGTRLRPLTDNLPKCLVPLFGTPLLTTQISVLKKCNIETIQVIVGHGADKIKEAGYSCSENIRYQDTNMVASLFSAREFMRASEDLIIGYGDIIYQANNLHTVLDSDADISIMVDLNWRAYWQLRFDNPLSDAETLIMDDDNYILSLGEKTEHYDHIHEQYSGLI